MYNPTVDVKYSLGDEETIECEIEVCDIEKGDLDEDDHTDDWEIIKYNDFADISVDLLKKLDLDELEDLVKGLVEHGDKYKVYYLHDTSNASLDDFNDRFRGCYDDTIQYTKKYWIDTGMLDEILILLPYRDGNYIDWVYAANELFNEQVFSLEYEDGLLVFDR